MKKICSPSLGLHLAMVFWGLAGHSALAQTNDHFANLVVIQTNRTWVTANNSTASKESGEPNHAGNIGGRSVWWSWRATESGYLQLSTWGSTTRNNYELDTLLAVYTGDRVNALTLVASNDDFNGGPTSELRFPVTAGNVYRIAVDGYTFGSEVASGTIWLYLNFYTSIPGRPAPAWNVSDLEGVRISSTNFAGKVVLLNFWATWCQPCIEEIPDLVSLHNQYSPDGFSVIGVSIDDRPAAEVSAFAQEKQMNFPILLSDSTMEQDYGGLPLIPTTFVIDRENNIVLKVEGLKSREFYEALIKQLLYRNVRADTRQESTGLVISWPAMVVNFSLELTTNLFAPNWSPAAEIIETEGTNRVVRLTPGQPAAFYRLRME